ncbi:hypothetical protein, partial [Bacteroides congonensis]|uniref:hypothetical protein n=1 Tax=Bacteroides congonensis TaxID=1871006 RepID=UPI0032194E9A
HSLRHILNANNSIISVHRGRKQSPKLQKNAHVTNDFCSHKLNALICCNLKHPKLTQILYQLIYFLLAAVRHYESSS